MPELFGDTNRASVRVLAKNGFDVSVPPEQGCCGALLAHRGDAQRVRTLADSNAKAFAAAEVLVTNSAGCGAELRSAEYWQSSQSAPRVLDITEFLAEVGLRPPPGRVVARVCYDDPCHLVHGQGVRSAPRQLLSQIPGIELLAHAEPDACCGAAGIYNLSQPQMSRTVLDRKLDALEAADPDLIASGNPGCLMQLGAGLRLRGSRARVLHPVELLDLAYAETPPT